MVGRGDLTSFTFFMMPALRLEKVMCRRDLSWINLMSIFLLSRLGLSSSSSSSSAAALMRGRLTPRESPAVAPLPLPVARTSSWAEGDCCESGSTMSVMVREMLPNVDFEVNCPKEEDC